MKAITIDQPWAALLALGLKQYETRSWKTEHRGPIAIHASLKPPTDEEWKIIERMPVGRTRALARCLANYWGFIIARVVLVDCIPVERLKRRGKGKLSRFERLVGDFSAGRFAWQFEGIEVLNDPIPARGKQRLWDWVQSDEAPASDGPANEEEQESEDEGPASDFIRALAGRVQR